RAGQNGPQSHSPPGDRRSRPPFSTLRGAWFHAPAYRRAAAVLVAAAGGTLCSPGPCHRAANLRPGPDWTLIRRRIYNFYSAGQRANASRASDPRAGGSLLVRRQLNPLIRHRVLFILLFAVVLCARATAQTPPDKPAQGKPQPPAKPAQPPVQDDQTSKIGVYEVRLPVAVREKNKFVSGLSKNNFEVYEDGKRQQIETF